MRARLVFWNVAAIGLILASMGFALRYRLQSNLLSQIDRDLEHDLADISVVHRKADSIDPLFAKEISGKRSNNILVKEDVDKLGIRLQQLSKGATDEVSLVSSAPRPILIPAKEIGDRLPMMTQPIDFVGFRAAKLGRKTFHDFRDHGRALRSLSAPIQSGGQLIAVAQSFKDLAPMRASLNQLDASLATMIPLALLVATITGAVLVGNTMRPLRRLTDAARSLDAHLSLERLPVEGKDEFTDLALAFNEALDRTSSAFTAQTRALQQLERFTGDAGHELRTPLGAIKGSISFLLVRRKWGAEIGKSLEIIDRSSDRMTRLISDLLLLARHDGGRFELAKCDSSLRKVINDAVSGLVVPTNVSFQVCVESDLLIFGDPNSLSRAFTNLLANAFAYSRTQVRVSAALSGQSLDVTIEDDGDGIDPEHLPRLGERFYRPESSRSRVSGGTGLGLAIVRSLIESHEGSMQIESVVGVGTKIHLVLPQP